MLDTFIIIFSIFLVAAGLYWRRLLRKQDAQADSAQPLVSAKADKDAKADTDVKADAKAAKDAKADAEADTEDGLKAAARAAKLQKAKKIISAALIIIGGFLLLTRLLTIVFGHHEESLDHISIWPDRMDVFGLNVSVTIVYSWVIMAVLVVAALIIRLTVFRHPSDYPTGFQNVVETIVEAVGNYTKAQAHGTGEMLCSYILTIAVFLVSCAALELFRLRAPTSDITITFSLALMTFVLINVYGIKRKGVIGRVKSLASPTPIVFPFRLISEIAIPVSLACRLFGNMLGGMVVVDLLYNALGNNAIGIPGVLGLYFNIFHPLIQAFIFVTLTLTFTNEAIENT